MRLLRRRVIKLLVSTSHINLTHVTIIWGKANIKVSLYKHMLFHKNKLRCRLNPTVNHWRLCFVLLALERNYTCMTDDSGILWRIAGLSQGLS